MNNVIEEVKDKKIEDIIYFVKSGDTLNSIANKFCVKIEELALDNDLLLTDCVSEGDILWVRKRNLALHIVKPLETLEIIAKKYDVSVSHIQKLNDIQNIFIGQKLII